MSNPAKGQRETPPDVNPGLILIAFLLWVTLCWNIRKGSMVWQFSTEPLNCADVKIVASGAFADP